MSIAIQPNHVALQWVLVYALVLASWHESTVSAAEEVPGDDAQGFYSVVQPFLQTYCLSCHGAEKQEGRLDLSHLVKSVPAVENYRIWEAIGERLDADEMPPKTEPHQPPAEQRDAVRRRLKALWDREATRNAGDPGIVLARRLSNAEFDYTIRDLTGVDLRPAQEFPIDPANEAGFDNSGESLTMSPALVTKYVAAANFVAQHLVLTHNRLLFAPKILVTDRDRDEFCTQRVIDFYVRHEVDYADYFFAAWEYQHRELRGEPEVSIKEIARRPHFRLQRSKILKTAPRVIEDAGTIESPVAKSPLSPRYLETLLSALQTPEPMGPMAELQKRWANLCERFAEIARGTSPSLESAIPQEGAQQTPEVLAAFPQWKIELRKECEQLREFVIEQRLSLNRYFEPLQIRGLPIRSVPLLSTDSQPLVTWYNQQNSARRCHYTGTSKNPLVDAALDRFCQVFPNSFAVTGRQTYLVGAGASPKIPLSAGFTYQHGVFRDDEPLCNLVLDERERAELDDLWLELNYVTRSSFRQFLDFLWHDRGEPPAFIDGKEFDFARPENEDVILQPNLDRLRDLYVAKLRPLHTTNPRNLETSIQAVKTYFDQISTDLRWHERAKLEAEPKHLDALQTFAERAFRRPLETREKDDLLDDYRELRDQDGLSHEEAIHDSIVRILVSPKTCYRIDVHAPDEGSRPLNDFELASRLSYFLWASMPDQELLASAAQGTLHEPAVLMAQVRRMLRDDRIRGLATEFVGHWLEFRRFEQHNTVDLEKFPAFTDQLRNAMFEEPLRLFMYIARENRSVLELLNADYTFVNPTLAAHYEIKANSDPLQPPSNDSEWKRVDHVNAIGRGGLLTMSVFLTQSSPGLRTSPVKRGYWVVSRLLGERILPPPATVPELPKDEATAGELTIPQLLARHRSNAACAGCHQRFDSIGIVFEGYGPVGERREKDLGGHPVDTHAVLPNGAEATGVQGLKDYLRLRQDEYLNNFCRKLLSYAIGRGLIPSDQLFVDQMRQKLVQDGYRFESLVESIVTSSQFMNKHGSR